MISSSLGYGAEEVGDVEWGASVEEEGEEIMGGAIEETNCARASGIEVEGGEGEVEDGCVRGQKFPLAHKGSNIRARPSRRDSAEGKCMLP